MAGELQGEAGNAMIGGGGTGLLGATAGAPSEAGSGAEQAGAAGQDTSSAAGAAGAPGGDVCNPGDQACEEGDVVECNGAGDGFVLSDPCQSDESCLQSGNQAICSTQACIPEAPSCDENLVRVCLEDGSAYGEVLQDCTELDERCYAGECLPVVCEGETDCVGRDVQRCTNNGTAGVAVELCLGDTYCDDSGETPACAPQICTPFETICSSDVVYACPESGLVWEQGEDCAPSGFCEDGVCQVECESDENCSESLVCAEDGVCRAEAADELGAPCDGDCVADESAMLYGVYYEVHDARSLSELSIGLETGAGVRIVVYESSTEAGTYSLVYNGPGTDDAAGQYFAQQMSVVLDASRFYLLGVVVQGGHELPWDVASYPIATTFGEALAGHAESLSSPYNPPGEIDYAPSGSVPHQILLTVRP